MNLEVLMKQIWKTVIAMAVATCLAQPAWADEPIRDSDAAAANGFLADVQNAKGVILRVPVNAAGEENTSEATLRVYAGDTRAAGSFAEAESIWNASKDQGNVPQVDEEAIVDGATWGWNRYNYGFGWRGGYNYYNYRPYSYYYGNYYNYGYSGYYNYYPTYYTNYYGNFGYRYYYWCY